MFRLRRDTKYILIVIVIALSVFMGLRKSNLQQAFSKKKTTVDISYAENLFEDSANERKIKLVYQVKDFDNIKSTLSSILKDENVYTELSETKGSYFNVVFEFPKTKYEEITKKLREVEGLDVENIQSASAVRYSPNIEANLKNSELSKKRIQDLMNRTSSHESIKHFGSQIRIIQATIDSLRNQKKVQSHNSNYSTVSITAIKHLGDNSMLRNSLNVFVLTTFISLITMICALIIFYYISIMLVKVMELMGIKTVRGSSGYGYNYGKKSYGRQVKRIYKDIEDKNKKDK
ncbi:MAG: DUF4349 domain-containing protein [Candidatus Cloacimonetes bacterium]|nr:DUF4349 domain-containing protein [Candidatus Cloacimonadota bacterium]